MKDQASPNSVWNWLCKRQNRRVALGSILLLILVLGIASSANKAEEPRDVTVENTEVVEEEQPAETPAPTPDDRYRSEAETPQNANQNLRGANTGREEEIGSCVC